MLPRLTLFLGIAAFVYPAHARAQSTCPLVGISHPDSAAYVSSVPRFVNRGDEIIQSQTARPIPPRELPAPPPAQATPDDRTADTEISMESPGPDLPPAMDASSDQDMSETIDPRLLYEVVVVPPRHLRPRPGPVPGNAGDNRAYWPNYTSRVQPPGAVAAPRRARR